MEAVEYILEIIHIVLNVVNRLIELDDGSMDLQVFGNEVRSIIYSDYLLV